MIYKLKKKAQATIYGLCFLAKEWMEVVRYTSLKTEKPISFQSKEVGIFCNALLFLMSLFILRSLLSKKIFIHHR